MSNKTTGHRLLLLLGALATGCSGGHMLKTDQSAPALSADGAVHSIDGRTLRLDELSRQGPVMVVLLRGFS